MLDELQKAMTVLVIHQEPPASLGRQAKKACEKRNDAPVVTSGSCLKHQLAQQPEGNAWNL